jgi:hypothetical protein
MKEQMRILLLILRQIEDGVMSEEKTLKFYEWLFAKKKEK